MISSFSLLIYNDVKIYRYIEKEYSSFSLVASNIKSGVKIFNVKGSAVINNMNNILGKTLTKTTSQSWQIATYAYYLGGIPSGTTKSITASSTPLLIIMSNYGYYSGDYATYAYGWIPSCNAVIEIIGGQFRSAAYAPPSSYTVPYALPCSNSTYGNLFLRNKTSSDILNGPEMATTETNRGRLNYPILSLSGNTVTATFSTNCSTWTTASDSYGNYYGSDTTLILACYS